MISRLYIAHYNDGLQLEFIFFTSFLLCFVQLGIIVIFVTSNQVYEIITFFLSFFNKLLIITLIYYFITIIPVKITIEIIEILIILCSILHC